MDESLMLIPSLPHDLAISCLARLPPHTRAMACCVSRAWRSALNNKSSIASLRLSLNLPPDNWIFVGLCDTESDPGYLEAMEENTQWLLLDPLSTRALLLPNPLCGISVDRRLQSAATNGKIILSEIPVYLKKIGFCSYDIQNDEGWNAIPFPPGQQPRRFACAETREFLYLSGGLLEETAEASRSARRYKTRNNRWETLPDMIMPRINCACVVLNGMFFAIGGYNSSAGFIETHASGEFFDPEKWKWILVPNLSANGLRYAEDSNVREPAIAVVEKKLYAIQSHSNEIMEFDLVKERWTHFGYVGGDSEMRSCSVNYKLLGVGSELWVIQYSMGKHICIYICLPSKESGSVKWRQAEVPEMEGFDYVLTCTVSGV